MLKKTTGMTDDPSQSSALKDQMKELNKKLAKEDEALKSLEPSAEEQKAEKDRIKAEQKAEKDRLAAAGAADAPAADAPAADAPAADGAAADGAAADGAAADGADAKLKAAKEALAKAKEGDDEEAIKKAQSAVDALGAKESKSTKGYNKIMNESKYQPQSVRDRFSRLL